MLTETGTIQYLLLLEVSIKNSTKKIIIYERCENNPNNKSNNDSSSHLLIPIKYVVY